jgi:hypothetical protein
VSAPPRSAAATAELAALYTLMHREDAAALAYAAAARRTGDGLLRRIAGQDAQHALALRDQLEGLTVGSPPPPRGGRVTDSYAAPLSVAAARHVALAAAVDLEEKLGSAYSDAARRVRDPRVFATLSTIAASHAQQQVALRAALGRPMLMSRD